MRVCVIGAGPSGLTTIKQLLDEGHEVTCFDAQPGVGGIWLRHDDDHDQMKAYDNLILTISMKLMSFSDFVMKGERQFATQAGYFEYLRQYADKFGLTKHIRFNSEVQRVRKVNDEWRVTVASRGETMDFAFGAVAFCAGPFRKPNTSSVPGLSNFTGEVVHSSQYRNNEKYRDKRVLVVGLAESGADILREVSNVASACSLSIRSHTMLLPRLFGGRYATDNGTFRAHHYDTFVRAADLDFPMSALFQDESCSREQFMRAAGVYGLALLAQLSLRSSPKDPGPASAVNAMGEPLLPYKLDIGTPINQETLDYINAWNRKAHEGESTYTPKIIYCKNVSFVPNILAGKIRVDDSGIEDIQGRAVRFKGGRVEEFDVILLCTGFKPNFSILGDGCIPADNVRNLYKHAFHADHAGLLAVIGFVRPFTGALPLCAEMQARYFALLCSGKVQLPSDVKQRIGREKEWEEALTKYSPRSFDAIPSQILFCDSIATEIGCLPKASELIQDPELFNKLWYQSFNQAIYRLKGPHSMPGAAREELMADEFAMDDINLLAMLVAFSSSPAAVHPPHAPLGEVPLKIHPVVVKELQRALADIAANARQGWSAHG